MRPRRDYSESRYTVKYLKDISEYIGFNYGMPSVDREAESVKTAFSGVAACMDTGELVKIESILQITDTISGFRDGITSYVCYVRRFKDDEPGEIGLFGMVPASPKQLLLLKAQVKENEMSEKNEVREVAPIEVADDAVRVKVNHNPCGKCEKEIPVSIIQHAKDLFCGCHVAAENLETCGSVVDPDFLEA